MKVCSKSSIFLYQSWQPIKSAAVISFALMVISAVGMALFSIYGGGTSSTGFYLSSGVGGVSTFLFIGCVIRLSSCNQTVLKAKQATEKRSSSFEYEGMTFKDVNAEERPILEKRQNIEEFIRAEYPHETSRTQKYTERLRLISTCFEKTEVYPVRGDGNCFCNAAVAGLLSLLRKDPEKKIRIIEGLKSSLQLQGPYVKPDNTSTAYAYNKEGFTKEKDFELVLSRLKEETIKEEFFEDFSFLASFARVLRYLIYSYAEKAGLTKGEFSLVCGTEIDMSAIYVLNSLFDLQATFIVLEAPVTVQGEQVDHPEPGIALRLKGKKFSDESSSFLSLDDRRHLPEKEECDFLLLRKSAHIVALVSS